MERLAAAREIVTSDPYVLGGTPVVRGTRVPVHDVAAFIAARFPIDGILSAYPSLDTDKVEPAAILRTQRMDLSYCDARNLPDELPPLRLGHQYGRSATGTRDVHIHFFSIGYSDLSGPTALPSGGIACPVPTRPCVAVADRITVWFTVGNGNHRDRCVRGQRE